MIEITKLGLSTLIDLWLRLNPNHNDDMYNALLAAVQLPRIPKTFDTIYGAERGAEKSAIWRDVDAEIRRRTGWRSPIDVVREHIAGPTEEREVLGLVYRKAKDSVDTWEVRLTTCASWHRIETLDLAAIRAVLISSLQTCHHDNTCKHILPSGYEFTIITAGGKVTVTYHWRFTGADRQWTASEALYILATLGVK